MKKEYNISDVPPSGISVKDYLRGELGFSARALKNAKYHGNITVNGICVHTNCILKQNDILSVEITDMASESIVPQEIPLEILSETEDFLIVNKPSGMASHPTLSHRDGTLANAVMYYYRDIPFTFRLLTRLDVDTSGVAVIAKNPYFAGVFASCRPQKIYQALCVGTPCPLFGSIDLPIGREPDSLIKHRILSTGKPSQTWYCTLQQFQGLSLVEIHPLTGRTHQIRLHMAYIGCPIYGDFLYGTEVPGERTRLHCKKIRFHLPQTNCLFEAESPMPSDFLALM